MVVQNRNTQQTKFRNTYRIESTRLKQYDYSSNGAYFITICTKNRENYLGRIIDGKLQENEQSKICKACWLDLSNHYPNCVLDEFVIMPNHVHGIVFIQNNKIVINGGIDGVDGDCNRIATVETGLKPVSTNVIVNTIANVNTNAIVNTNVIANTIADTNITKRYSISEIIRGFKTFTARKINDFLNTQGKTFWQSRFYDNVIRDKDELNRIRKYIVNNPVSWLNDRNNKENIYI